MADIHGRLGKVAIDIGAGYVEIAGVKEIEMNAEQSTADVTDHDSGQFEEFIVGRKNISFSVTCNYDEADAGQEAVIATGLMAGTILTGFRFRPQTGGGFKQYLGVGIVTNVTGGSPNDAASEMSFDIQMSGTLTRSNQ